MISVKANALSHLTDARYFASMEVAWMGFNIDPIAENASSPLFVKTIREWISGPELIGEFNYASATEILTVFFRGKVNRVVRDGRFSLRGCKDNCWGCSDGTCKGNNTDLGNKYCGSSPMAR